MKSEYVLIHAAPIKHYGIKGQKKGVRRFQLDSGELTAAGKSRYGVSTSGNKPYSTPYNEPQGTVSGRKKNITGTISGATVNKSKSYKVANGTNNQLASPVKVDKDKLSSRVNEKARDNAIKVAADLADNVSDRVKAMDVIAKIQNSFDNGAVNALKKKDLVKIKSGKNTRR